MRRSWSSHAILEIAPSYSNAEVIDLLHCLDCSYLCLCWFAMPNLWNIFWRKNCLCKFAICTVTLVLVSRAILLTWAFEVTTSTVRYTRPSSRAYLQFISHAFNYWNHSGSHYSSRCAKRIASFVLKLSQYLQQASEYPIVHSTRFHQNYAL